LGFHVKQAGADAKLIQHGPLGVAYHRRHPISTVPVARITAHATVFKFLMSFSFCPYTWKNVHKITRKVKTKQKWQFMFRKMDIHLSRSKILPILTWYFLGNPDINQYWPFYTKYRNLILRKDEKKVIWQKHFSF
jgi:hypothetical protein